MSTPFGAVTELPIRRLANNLGIADGWLSQSVIQLPDGSPFLAPRVGWGILIRAVVEQFYARFAPGSEVICIADTDSRFVHLETQELEKLGVVLKPTDKIPDLIIHIARKNWLLLVEVVVSARQVDGKRREELVDLFQGCKAELVFLTALQSRESMRRFLPQIPWETAVWVADEPDHLIHFDGGRFLGPYADADPL